MELKYAGAPFINVIKFLKDRRQRLPSRPANLQHYVNTHTVGKWLTLMAKDPGPPKTPDLQLLGFPQSCSCCKCHKKPTETAATAVATIKAETSRLWI